MSLIFTFSGQSPAQSPLDCQAATPWEQEFVHIGADVSFACIFIPKDKIIILLIKWKNKWEKSKF